MSNAKSEAVHEVQSGRALRQHKPVCDAVGKLLFVVRHHDERLVRTLAELLDDLSDELSVRIVEAVERLVENQQFRVLHKSSRQEAKALLAAAQLQERAVCHAVHTEDSHPIGDPL